MKKIISLTLAASMVAGMSVASFARPSDPTVDPYVDNWSDVYVKREKDDTLSKNLKGGVEIKDGDMVAVKVETNDLKDSDMKKYKAFFEAGVGGDAVESVSLEYHKYLTESVKDDGDDRLVIDNAKKIAGSLYEIGSVKSSVVRKIYENILDYVEMPRKMVKIDEDLLEEWTIKMYLRMENKTVSELDRAEYTTGEGLDNGEYSFVFTKKDDALDYIVLDAETMEFLLGNKMEAYHMEEDLVEAKDAAVKVVEAASTEKKYDYAWFVVVDFVNEEDVMDEDVMGKITIAKTAAQAKDNFGDEDLYKEVNFVNVNYDNRHHHEMWEAHQEVEDFTFEKNGQQAMFIVDTTGVEKFPACFDTTNNEAVWDKYAEPDYEVFFYNWHGTPTFNRTGDLYFYSDNTNFKDFHVYEIVDAKTGELKEIPAVYDEAEGTIKIRTRQLRNYVLSAEDLLAADVAPEAEKVPEADKVVPETGR